MAINPNTTIYLCAGIPWGNDYAHVRLFQNMEERLSFLSTKIIATLDGATYQRDDKFVSFPANYETIANCNYMYYRNNNRWYFNFITDIRFQNENKSDVYFEQDVFQTWFADDTLKISFVEREHTNDDTFGNNLVPENLETGEYVYNTNITSGYGTIYDFTPGIIIGVSERLDGAATSDLLDNAFTGLSYYYAKKERFDVAVNFVEEYAKSGKADAIITIFMYPLELINVFDASPSYGWVSGFGNERIYGNKLLNVFAPLDGYTPKNNKMYSYPYRALEVYGSGSGGKEYRYEYFDFDAHGTNGPFVLFSALGGSAPIVATPLNYKGLNICLDESVTMNAFPTCSWVNDTFKNWYAQNQLGLNIGVVTGTIAGAQGAITGVLTGNYVGAVDSTVGAVSKILDTMVTITQHQILPDSARGNTASANAFFANGQWYFYMFPKCIRYEFAKRIDDYFTMFGYKTNKLKIPNLYGRKSWNFVKCTECNLIDSIPVVAHNRIKQAFETGVTFWHTNDIKNYDLDNSIV